MILEIKDGRYVSQMWFLAGDNRDFLACLFREDSGNFRLNYRFRYYIDDKIHDSGDRKSFWSGLLKPGIAEDEAG